ncbi:amidase [Agrobacterium arsenijevicii]|uniref:amidase n=1 Tax=Agrobacterium arsenijevicii TaxID=1585697 RepID=UPI0005D317D4
MTNFPYGSISDLRWRALIDGRNATSDVERFRQRATAMNPANHAYISISGPLQQKAEEPLPMAGLLAGVPYACKDVFRTKSMITTAGSRVLADYQPKTDARAVERLEHAGAVLIGKTNMHEFCYGITGKNPVYGTPVNPHDRSRLAGGSSSGSAISVATGSAVFALGSDTGGSVRVPAALCGLVGLKPTYGLISTKGMIPFCWTLDHAGIVARSCLDTASVLQVLAGWSDAKRGRGEARLERRLLELSTDFLKGKRIGIPRRYFFENLDDEIRSGVEKTLLFCRDHGAELVEVLTPDMTHVRPASLAIQLVEALSWHGPRMDENAHLYGDDVRNGLVQGQFILAEHYVQSLRLMELKRREFAACFKSVDIMITPTTPVIAPDLSTKFVKAGTEDELVGNALTRYTCVFNLTGHPALTIPCGRHSSGLPMGLQIIGKPYEDIDVLSIGHVLEAAGALGWIEPASGAASG